MRLRPLAPNPAAEAETTRRLARFYREQAEICGCAHLHAASRLCFRRARKLDLEARKAA